MLVVCPLCRASQAKPSTMKGPVKTQVPLTKARKRDATARQLCSSGKLRASASPTPPRPVLTRPAPCAACSIASHCRRHPALALAGSGMCIASYLQGRRWEQAEGRSAGQHAAWPVLAGIRTGTSAPRNGSTQGSEVLSTHPPIGALLPAQGCRQRGQVFTRRLQHPAESSGHRVAVSHG